MQNLDLSKVLDLINLGQCFEATCEGSFIIKIQEYVPYVCTAIHNGHELREDLKDICLLSEKRGCMKKIHTQPISYNLYQ